MHVYEGWNKSGPQEPHKLAKKIGWGNNLSDQGTETMYPNPETIELRARKNERNKRFLRTSGQ